MKRNWRSPAEESSTCFSLRARNFIADSKRLSATINHLMPFHSRNLNGFHLSCHLADFRATQIESSSIFHSRNDCNIHFPIEFILIKTRPLKHESCRRSCCSERSSVILDLDKESLRIINLATRSSNKLANQDKSKSTERKSIMFGR